MSLFFPVGSVDKELAEAIKAAAALGLWEGLSHSALLHSIVIVLKSHSASLRSIVIVLKCQSASLHLVVSCKN